LTFLAARVERESRAELARCTRPAPGHVVRVQAQTRDPPRARVGTVRDNSLAMNKPFAVILAVLGWAGVILVQNFSKLVPHASPQEVKPFEVPVLIFALVATALCIKVFATKSKT
jgi:hypothetical protein